MYAASKGHLNIIRMLLENGAAVAAKTKSGYTALMLAEKYDNFQIAMLLRKAGAKK